MQLWTLASGSSGNCFLLESEGTRLLVECGRPLRDVLRYLEQCEVEPASLDGILLTHAHADHRLSAREMSDRFRLPLYASVGTLGHPSLRDNPLARPIRAAEPFSVGEIEVHPFAVPHDCVEPLGFRFESHSGRACIATDLGWVPPTVQRSFLDLDLLVLESNYDPHLLHTGRYPAFLKHRVSGNRGHLSNGDAAAAIAACGDRAPGAIWLGHISEKNNTASHALRAVSTTLRQRGLGHVPVKITRHRRPSLYWNSRASSQQLALW